MQANLRAKNNLAPDRQNLAGLHGKRTGMCVRKLTRLMMISVLLIGVSRHSHAGDRFLLGPPSDGDPVCSILVPTGWFPDATSSESSDKYRFVFEPVKGTSPTILLDVDEAADLDALRESWRQQLPPKELFDGDDSGREFYDPVRKLAWSLASNDRACSVTVTVLRNRLYRLRFVDTQKASDAFKTTVQEIVENCDFKAKLIPPPPTSREKLASMFADAESIPFQLKYQDVIGIPGLQWKLGLVVGIALLSLLGIERHLRAMKDAQRIADAEAAIEARENAERSSGMRQSLLEPEPSPSSKSSRRRRKVTS